MTLTPQILLTELDTALSEVSPDWRNAVLRQITDLFFNRADLYTKEQVALFDSAMSMLLPGLDRQTLAELSNRLADLTSAPARVLASLANHSDPLVCAPVLERSKALPDKVLIAVADRERVEQSILAKIAARKELSPALTDSLLKRGNAAVQRTLLENPNARISEGGITRVVMGLDGDKSLAQLVASRQDLPAGLRPRLNEILSS
jgi:uncharacterized protein (DUF2336 family)